MNEANIRLAINKSAEAFHGLTASEAITVLDGLLLFILGQTESYRELYDAHCDFLLANKQNIFNEVKKARDSIKAKSQS